MPPQSFEASLDSLEPIRDYVQNAAQAAGLDRQAVYNATLAVDEIVTNIITHGYEEAGLKGVITVGADLEEDRLVLRVEDWGKPYDPNAHQVPSEEDLKRPLEDRAGGGLGILLARAAAHEIQYTASSNGNVHRLVMLLPDGRKAPRRHGHS